MSNQKDRPQGHGRRQRAPRPTTAADATGVMRSSGPVRPSTLVRSPGPLTYDKKTDDKKKTEAQLQTQPQSQTQPQPQTQPEAQAQPEIQAQSEPLVHQVQHPGHTSNSSTHKKSKSSKKSQGSANQKASGSRKVPPSPTQPEDPSPLSPSKTRRLNESTPYGMECTLYDEESRNEENPDASTDKEASAGLDDSNAPSHLTGDSNTLETSNASESQPPSHAGGSPIHRAALETSTHSVSIGSNASGSRASPGAAGSPLLKVALDNSTHNASVGSDGSGSRASPGAVDSPLLKAALDSPAKNASIGSNASGSRASPSAIDSPLLKAALDSPPIHNISIRSNASGSRGSSGASGSPLLKAALESPPLHNISIGSNASGLRALPVPVPVPVLVAVPGSPVIHNISGTSGTSGPYHLSSVSDIGGHLMDDSEPLDMSNRSIDAGNPVIPTAGPIPYPVPSPSSSFISGAAQAASVVLESDVSHDATRLSDVLSSPRSLNQSASYAIPLPLDAPLPPIYPVPYPIPEIPEHHPAFDEIEHKNQQEKYNLQRELILALVRSSVVLGINNFMVRFCLDVLKGDGFMSDVYRGGIINIETNEEVQLIIKKAPTNPSIRTATMIDSYYSNESYFYLTVLPTLKDFENNYTHEWLKKNFNNHPQYVMCEQTPGQEWLVLKDLTTDNYIMRPREIFLDYPHAMQLFQTYGHFHALSFCMKHKQPERYQRLIKPIIGITKKAADSTGYITFMESVMKTTASLLNPKTHAHLILKMEKYVAHTKEILIEAVTYIGDYSCIIHGDCWSNNNMFKYQDGTMDSPITSLKLLDFQMINVASPMYDLSYCLYSGGNEYLFNNLEVLLVCYYQSFSSTCLKLNCNPHELLPKHVLMQEWKENCKIGLILSLIIIRLKLMQTTELSKMLKAAEEHVQETSELPQMADTTDPAVVNRIIQLLEHVDRLGAL